MKRRSDRLLDSEVFLALQNISSWMRIPSLCCGVTNQLVMRHFLLNLAGILAYLHLAAREVASATLLCLSATFLPCLHRMRSFLIPMLLSTFSRRKVHGSPCLTSLLAWDNNPKAAYASRRLCTAGITRTSSEHLGSWDQ